METTMLPDTVGSGAGRSDGYSDGGSDGGFLGDTAAVIGVLLVR
jgi:hypothetical protein